MENHELSRWQQFYLNDPKLGSIPPSACANRAAGIFTKSNCRIILDVGCGTGRDTFRLASDGAQVIGLDVARSGLSLAQKRAADLGPKIFWIESDARFLPFHDAMFDAVYCFGLLHEFTTESARTDMSGVLDEIRRVTKPNGAVIVAVAAGNPEKGLPHVQNFSEAMFDNATSRFHRVEKELYDDLGCTGRTDYKVWFGHFLKV